MTRRAHITLKTKLASALLALGHVPYEHAKAMSEDMLISLYQFDHNQLHAFGGPDAFWNLAPVLIAPHREKNKRDKAITSKADRLDRINAEHQRRLLAKDRGEAKPPSRWGTRKLQSRPFNRRGHV